jgi:hypothetical protein
MSTWTSPDVSATDRLENLLMPFPKTDDELAKAGYKYEGTSRCTGANCKAEIAWYRTPKGKHIPLNEGTLEPHWTTCADSEAFRK